MRKVLSENIIHEDAAYTLTGKDGGELVLSLYYCNNKKYAAGFNGLYLYDDIGDLDIGVSPLGLMRKVKHAVIEWAMTDHPASFSFVACTDRKKPIYNWFAKRILKEIAKYYIHVKHGDIHWFYKK